MVKCSPLSRRSTRSKTEWMRWSCEWSSLKKTLQWQLIMLNSDDVRPTGKLPFSTNCSWSLTATISFMTKVLPSPTHQPQCPATVSSVRVGIGLFVAAFPLPLLAYVFPEELDGELRLRLFQEIPSVGCDDVFRVARNEVETFFFQFGSEVHVADR